jgi:hypothetical protein
MPRNSGLLRADTANRHNALAASAPSQEGAHDWN